MNQAKYQPDRPWTEEDFELIEDYYALEARKSLWAFRQYMNPNMVKGWFPYDLSCHLQRFFTRLMAGERPKLVIMAPPQHGKTNGLQDAIAWYAGLSPDLKTIYASYSEDLGVSTNMYLQRMMDDRAKYGRVFPNTMLGASNVVTAVAGSGRFLRNSSFLEFVGQKGSFRNATVDGQVTGKGLDLGVIDDPIKGRNEARSKNIRDKTWMWLMDDFFNRFSEYAGLILTMTRWDVDDPAGRFLLNFPDAEVLSYPAEYRRPKPDERNLVVDPRTIEGMPLFPEFKSAEFLKERRSAYTKASWESLYMQSPIVGGGETFPVDKVHIIPNPPDPSEIRKSVRYWDKAGTSGSGAWTAGVLMHELVRGSDRRWAISDVKRAQVNAWDRENLIKTTADNDKATWGRVDVVIEQEPGSGGKESAERTVANLRGHRVIIDVVRGSKETRAEPYASQWQGGNIDIVSSTKWNPAFIDEHETFPSGSFKDQVDAAAGAFAKITAVGTNYDTSMRWAANL